MYARNIEGAEHTFGISGKLIMNALVMYDHQTDTLWSQFLGEGVSLDFVPVTHIPWRAWQETHPDTLVLDKRGGYQFDSYSRYYRHNQTGVLGESHTDYRLAAKELVVGVSVGEHTKAYPFEALETQPVVNDSVAGQDILVFFETETETPLVYDRTIDGTSHTFRIH